MFEQDLRDKSKMHPLYTVTAWLAAPLPSPQGHVISGHRNRNVSFRMRVMVIPLYAKENTF